MSSPIVLPDPCLSETLHPRDFEIATRVLLQAAHPSSGARTNRRRERPAVFDPARAPWRRPTANLREI